MTDTADYPFPEPHPWPHSPNPTGIRRAADGRVALCFTWRGRDFAPFDGWLVVDAPNGDLTVHHLTDEDVHDWTEVDLP